VCTAALKTSTTYNFDEDADDSDGPRSKKRQLDSAVSMTMEAVDARDQESVNLMMIKTMETQGRLLVCHTLYLILGNDIVLTWVHRKKCWLLSQVHLPGNMWEKKTDPTKKMRKTCSSS
jgi:hypothetical protein